MTVTSSVRWLPMGRSPIGPGVTTVWHCQGIGTLELSPKRGCLDCSFLSRTRLFFSGSEGGQDKSRYDSSWVSVLKGAPVMVWDTIRSALLDMHFGDGHSRALKRRLKWLRGTHWLWAGLQASSKQTFYDCHDLPTARARSHHYHCTLDKGLEAQRVDQGIRFHCQSASNLRMPNAGLEVCRIAMDS